ncbi:MAG: helix-turn-helix transcriptional regulator [Negativicutes bacterium]|nr:helix-turn-helix transcriptional regulator [Negativicutes bacterium]
MEHLDLRSLRGKRPLKEVSKIIGITPQMLGKIELKRRKPSLGVAQKIANYYGVFVEQIFFNDTRDKTSTKLAKQTPTQDEQAATTEPGPKPAA